MRDTDSGFNWLAISSIAGHHYAETAQTLIHDMAMADAAHEKALKAYDGKVIPHRRAYENAKTHHEREFFKAFDEHIKQGLTNLTPSQVITSNYIGHIAWACANQLMLEADEQAKRGLAKLKKK